MMISAVILAKNAEDTIGQAVRSVSWCDEIIVIDDHSTDKTASIAQKAGAKLVTHALKDNFAAQRTYGESKAKGDWVFFLDADEVADEFVARDIQKSIVNTVYPAFAIKRVDRWFGQYEFVNQENGEHWITRLYKKGSGKWHLPVHEEYRAGDLVGKLQGTVMHETAESLHAFIEKLNTYAKIHAHDKKETPRFIDVYTKPIAKFFQVFVSRKAYRDRTYGFVLAVLMSFHSFLAWSEHFLSHKKK